MGTILKWEYAGYYFPEILSEVLVTLAIAAVEEVRKASVMTTVVY